MASLLLAIIYLAFISLGLPDSLLGSAWPEMHQVMGVELLAMGIVTTLISIGTVVSSLFSDAVTKKLSTPIVVAISVGLTSVGLMGFSFAPRFWVLCLFAIPYGLGAGSIDAALNNYVALHYTSRHMSWLHCFWGVGTVVSPYVMSYALSTELGWAGGYRIVGGIQILILAVLIATLPVWKKVNHNATSDTDEPEEQRNSVGLIGSLKIKGVVYVLLGFMGYCAAESTVMVWASTYFFEAKSTTAELAAALGSLFFIGMTVGRFFCGFISNRVGDKNMIRFGLGLSAAGVIIIAIPGGLPLAIAGFLLIGLGFAPVYPSIIHSTPNSFGKESSQAIIGIQMAAAYLGATLAPPIFGLIANYIEVKLLPLYLGIFIVTSFVMLELLNRKNMEKANKY